MLDRSAGGSRERAGRFAVHRQRAVRTRLVGRIDRDVQVQPSGPARGELHRVGGARADPLP
jgi:hypothetical protein